MKRWFYIVLLGFAVLGAVYVYLHRQELGLAGLMGIGAGQETNAEQTAPAPSPAHIVWQKVDRLQDGFKVEMPSDVKEIQIPAYNEQGGSDQVGMIFSYPDPETTYSVTWADDPPVARANNHVPERTLDMARNDALTRTQTTLVNESQRNVQGFPARDFAARNTGGGVLNARLVYVGSRLYMLIAAFPSEGARRGEDVTHFFDSFIVSPAGRSR